MNKHPQRILLRAGTLLVSVFLLLSMTGCFGVDGQFKRLRNSVVEGANVDYEVEVEFGIGPMLIGFAKKVVSWSDEPDSEMAVDLLDQIKKVQIGVYQLNDFHLERSEVRERVMEIVDYMGQNGYDSIVRNYEENGGNLIMVRCHPDAPEKVKEMVVISFDPSELNIVQLRGNVNELVDVAVREGEVPGIDEAVQESKSSN